MQKPYEGEEPYIFVSYSHLDTEAVMGIIARLMEVGYRVWYDEGIECGVEWDEYIDTRIEGCAVFMPFFSTHFLASDNCKDELALAKELRKELISVFLEDVEPPKGKRMWVIRKQNLRKYQYEEEEWFYHKLFGSSVLEACMAKEKPGEAQQQQEPSHSQSEEPDIDDIFSKPHDDLDDDDLGILIINLTSISLNFHHYRSLFSELKKLNRKKSDKYIGELRKYVVSICKYSKYNDLFGVSERCRHLSEVFKNFAVSYEMYITDEWNDTKLKKEASNDLDAMIQCVKEFLEHCRMLFQ